MGGKQKQAQRTKGNTRPSSSARAAEQLHGSGQHVGFIGFGALSGDLGYVPTTQGNDEADSNVDGDFRMLLRKLSKRDTVTKLKALDELTVLFNEKDIDSVKSVLPYWPRIYCKMSVDNERRVREGVQETFEALVLRVKRGLAPHLKALMGSWLVAQNDVYAPAASAAKSAFHSAFPPAKQTEAIVFCKEEIVMHIHDNLLNQTPATFSDPKTTDPEDMEAKYQKMIAATLQAWRSLLAALTPDQLAELTVSFTAILSDTKFWKHAKSQSPLIKGSFYSLLSGLCQHCPTLAQQYAEKISTLVLHNLDNTEPLICPSLWEAVLFTVTIIEDCWKHVNSRKAVWPKLWSLLRQGGAGSATSIYPNLLPLLSKIPAHVIGEHIKFYHEFFNSFKTGLILEKTIVSPSETGAIVTALLECLRFCLVQHLKESTENKNIQEFLLQDQLLPLIEASLVDKSDALSASPLYPGVVDLLTYIHKLATGVDSADSRDNKVQEASNVLKCLWTSLSIMITNHVERCETDVVLERTASLLVTFKNPEKCSRKNVRVRFSENEDSLKKASQVSHQRTGSGGTGTATKGSMLKRRSLRDAGDEDSIGIVWAFLQAGSPLMELVSRTCHIAHDQFHQTHSVLHLRFLSRTFTTFLSQPLMADLDSLSQHQAGGEPVQCSEIQFCRSVLLPWLTDSTSITDKDRSDVHSSLIEMTAALLGSAGPKYKPQLLSLLIQELDVHLLVILSRRLLQPRPLDPVIVRWFRGEEFGERISSVAGELCHASLKPTDTDTSQTKDMWDLLTLALSTGDNMESVVGEDYVDQILTQMRVSLPSPSKLKELTSEEINRCVTFVCDVATNFYSNIKGCLLVKSAEALLAALFHLSCQDHSFFSDDVRNRVYAAWQLGLRALLAQRGGHLADDGFFHQVAQELKSHVLQDASTYSRLKQLGDLAVGLCRTMAEELTELTEPNLHDPSVAALRNQLYLTYRHDAATQWSSWYLVSGHLTFGDLPVGIPSPQIGAVPKAIAPIAFTAQLLVATGLSRPTTSTKAEDDLDPAQNSEDSSRDGWTQERELLHEIAYSIAFCRTVMGKRREALKASEIGQLTCHLEDSFDNLMKQVNESRRLDLVQFAVHRSIKDGQLWAVCLGVILEEAHALKWSTSMVALLQPTERLNMLDEASLQSLQVSMKYLPLDEVRSLIEVVAAQVITCPQDKLADIQGGWGYLAVLVTALSTLSGPSGAADGGEATLPADVVISVLDKVQLWRDQQDNLFAFDKMLSRLSWAEVAFNITVMRLLEQMVAMVPTQLTATHWDFTLCSLVAWIQACSEASVVSLPVQAFTISTAQLLATVGACMKHVVPVEREAFPPNLTTEWTEFFSEGAYGPMLPIFTLLAETIPLTTPNAVDDQLLRSLSSSVALCPAEHLRNHRLPARLVADQESSLPDELQTLLNHLCPLLLAAHRAVQVTGYRLLLSIMPQLAAFDLNITKEDEEKKEEVSRSPPLALVAVLETSGTAMEVLLHDVRPGDPIFVPSHTEEYTATMGYLLSWKLALTFFKAAPSELRAQYALSLRDLGAVDSLLTNLFHLMPENPLVPLKDSLTAHSPNQKLVSTSNMFAEQPLLDPTGVGRSEEVQHVACSVYQQALQDIPAMVRTWWSSQDRRTAELVDKFTTNYVSPLLIAAEIGAIRQQQLSHDNMTISVRPAAREVAATYSIEDITMEIVVTLSVSHPLGVINVESGKRIGVANTQWRNWMLQMVTFLTHQNGSIVEGLMLWKKNVDKRFEGLDDCLICFSVIHGSNYQLPRLQCKVCKKKFHSACLYKWFNTSNNSTCPLCRNLF